MRCQSYSLQLRAAQIKQWRESLVWNPTNRKEVFILSIKVSDYSKPHFYRERFLAEAVK
jgi:hypothetical protein